MTDAALTLVDEIPVDGNYHHHPLFSLFSSITTIGFSLNGLIN